jgi:glutathione synthase
MDIVIVVNALEGVKPEQSTADIARGLLGRGHDVWYAAVGALGLGVDDVPTAHAVPVGADGLPAGRASRFGVDAFARVVIRTNPARDADRAWAHAVALDLLARARELGVVVMNDPDGLRRAGSKLYQLAVPAHLRPRTLVSRDAADIRAFVAAEGRAVLKPLNGTQGRDVFFIDGPGNLNQIIDVLVRDGHAMAQAWVPEAGDGDVRVLLLDGALLTVEGRAATVRRRPGKGELRSNIAQGGSAHPGVVTPAIREMVEAVGPRLRRDGIVLAGLDVVGDMLVEINAFSPGGLADAGRFAGVDFVAPILDRIEAGAPATD